MEKTDGVVNTITNLLQQDYRGVNIAVYALASAGLAASIYKIRPVSKFSKATKVPDHFISNHVSLNGMYAGVQHSPVRILVNHKAPIYLPLWHSSKPPLPVKLWGVDIVSGNAVNWLECVAKNREITLLPIGRDKDALISTVMLHLPQSKKKSVEILDVGKKLVELGFAQASVSQKFDKNTIESQLAPALLSAESWAKRYRNGVWSEKLPPLPFYVVYWRKGAQLTIELLELCFRQTSLLLLIVVKSALVGMKNLALRPFKGSSKQIQTT
ncbi:hypothetical protein ACJJTC_019523 [Scirpophaga incertulas]